ncbi:energy transducer TonB [Nodularia harveyana UHCC-0300]|uniref:Energy transducer TonB n=1 Tax=Nodularia harveyana UHCC-0300 TaxID=2974287 RepID=A0ABU5UAJ8_9CYAN|nr:energy transducer TonB [Nodularia harveyana]MEA5580542.1 energy transducer TonB [Nodularia harveyana UHCC-0300]
MGFSGITIKYRSQENEALKNFLIYSLIASLVLHIALLSFAITNLLKKTPVDIEDEPIDVTIIDFPLEELEKAPEEMLKEEQIPEPSKIIPTNNNSPTPARNEVVALESKPQITPTTSVTPPIPKMESFTTPPVPQAPPPPQIQKTTAPTQPTSPPRQQAIAKLESLLTSKSSESRIAAPPKNQSSEKLQESLTGVRDSRVSQETNVNSNIAAPPKNQSSEKLRESLTGVRDSRVSQETNVNSNIAAPPKNQSSEKLRESLTGVRDSRVSQETNVSSNIVANSSKPSTTNAVSTASTGNSTNNTRVPRAIAPVATAPASVPKPSNSQGNSNGSLSGRAACVQCNTSYPEFARRQGIEGKVKVAVDTDAQGNVTNVKILSSSGNRRLDEAVKKQAANWKLKPSESGRQRVSIDTEFALEGSRRYRQVQERKKKQEAAATERSPQTTTTKTPTPSKKEESMRPQPESAPSSNEAKPVTIPVRTPSQPTENSTTGSSSETETNPTPSPENMKDSLQNERTPTPEVDTNRRPRAIENTPSTNENQLQNSLHQNVEPAESSESGSQE